MIGLLLGIAAAFLGSAVHLCLLRKLPTGWRLFSLPPLLLAALALLLACSPAIIGAPDLEDFVVALVISLSAGFAYALVLAGVVYDSPTLSIVNTIESYGPAGMPANEFDGFASTHPFVRSRLDALISIGELRVENEDLVLTGRTVFLLQIGEAYRRVRGDRQAETG